MKSNNSKYSNKSRTGKSFKSRSSSSRPKTEEADVKKQKYNDPKWYTAAGQLPADVGSLSFNNALGTDIILDVEDASTADLYYDYGSIPGIMVIHTVPSIGHAPNQIAGVNIASKNIYSWVRHQNSGHSNYDSPDLMLYLLAMDQVYSCLSWLIRAYGVARVFSQTNRYVGKALLTSMGFDAEDIYSHLADFRAFINTAIVKAGSMCVPATMSYMVRHVWMYSNVYKDEDIAKSSMFVYNPAGFWKLDTTGSTHLTIVTIDDFNTTEGFKPARSTLITADMCKLIINSLMDPIISDEDMNIMSGDILKAFGRENLFGMSMIPEDYAVVPVYSEEVLEQIHNTSFVGPYPVNLSNSISLERLGVIQDTSIGSGNLLYTPMFKGPAQVHSVTHILDFYKETVAPEDVIVASRNLVSGYSGYDQSGNYISTSITGCGSEICLFATIYRFSGGLLPAEPLMYPNNADGYMPLSILNHWTKFNWAPIVVMRGFATATRFTSIVGQVGNYTTVHHDEITKLHETALLSEFGVPLLGNVSR